MPRKPARKAATQPPAETVTDLPTQQTPSAGEAELKGGFTSKYIGETEKNLGMLLDPAKQSDATLYYDESDDLFKR